MDKQRSTRWAQLLRQVADEYQALAAEEREWIRFRLDQISVLQIELQQLFAAGSGDSHCRDCRGECCHKGHNHMTLANLLAFVQLGTLPPAVDFTLTCPFLGDRGCLLAVEQRPYNCVTFICDTIEEDLTSAERERFYLLDRQLRRIYLEFTSRYAGAGMTGLLLQHQRLAGKAFLERI